MKNVKEIKEEIETIQSELRDDLTKMSDSKFTRLKNRIEFLVGLILYLESNPNETFLQSEIDRIENSIKKANENYEYWCKYNAPKDVDPKKYRTMFNQVTGVAKFKKQLKTIEYLLAA